jgi:hypothetical protein
MSIVRMIDWRLRRYAWWRKWRGYPEPAVNPVIEMIAREALALLRDKQTFISAINRQMDAPSGTLRVRKPNEYVKRP